MMVQEYTVEVYGERTECRNMEGELHRLDGPAIEYSNGHKEWWVNGQRHRVDGPAIIYSSGYKFWYVYGQQHRLDGPAVEMCDGIKSWWVNGQQLTEEEFNREVNPIQELSVEEISKRLGYEVKIVKS